MGLQGHTYIKLYRSLTDWEWYTEAGTVRVFLHLLLKASIKPYRYRGAEIPRGGCVITYPRLAEALGVSEKTIRTALMHLRETGAVTVSHHKGFSVATVTNYGVYQGAASVPPCTEKPPARSRGKPLPSGTGRPPSFDLESHRVLASRHRPQIPEDSDGQDSRTGGTL